MKNNLLVYRTISHFLSIAVLPEIDHRISSGKLKKEDLPLDINQFRIIWDRVNNKVIVELNEEVKISVKMKVKRPVKVGEAVTINDIDPDECYINNPEIDGKTCSFYICKSLYLGFTTYFNFLPNDPNYDEDKLRNLNLKYDISGFNNFNRYKKEIEPFVKLMELAKKNWPPAPNLYPNILLEYHKDSEIIKNNKIIDTILEVYSLDYWTAHLDFWGECNFFPDRLKYIKRSINAFFEDDFISCIYILVPQFEGIIKEYLISNSVISNRDTHFYDCIDAFRSHLYSHNILMIPKEIIEIVFDYLKTGSFWINTKKISDPKVEINRHGILHGIYADFESKELALKYLLLLDSLYLILLHDKMIKLSL